jgi:hypothetical protein
MRSELILTVDKDLSISNVCSNWFVLLGIPQRKEFDYKPVCSQFTTTHYVSTNKIIYVYFSHMTYLMSHTIFLNNICEWSYKLSHSGL